jgi:hypothetical protein
MAITSAQDGRLKIEPDGLQYVLPGATRRWQLSAGKGGPPAGDGFALSARSDRGVIKETVAVSD